MVRASLTVDFVRFGAKRPLAHDASIEPQEIGDLRTKSHAETIRI